MTSTDAVESISQLKSDSAFLIDATLFFMPKLEQMVTIIYQRSVLGCKK